MKPASGKLWIKLTALLLLVTVNLALCASMAGVIFMIYADAYTGDAYQVLENEYYDVMRSETWQVLDWYDNELNGFRVDFAEHFSRQHSNLSFTVTDESGNLLAQNYQEEDIQLSYESDYTAPAAEGGTVQLHITSRLCSKLEAKDTFYYMNYWMSRLLNARYWLIAISAVTLVISLLLTIYLICSAGRKPGMEGVGLSWQDRIPLDLFAAAVCLIIICLAALLAESYGWYAVVMAGILCVALTLLGMALLMTFAARAKVGAWWKNTVIYRFGAWTWRCIRGLVDLLLQPLRQLPLVRKTALIWFSLCGLELLLLAVWRCEGDMVFLWAVEKLLLTPAVLYSAISMRRLQTAAAELAAGELASQVDTSRLYGDFRTFGENINCIDSGLQQALDQRLRSERLKTELITNVSHDIKTPLTSIVNYVDLLKKQPVEPAEAREYIQVLDRQSARLKKLTEDLVEASKAATGNLPVSLEPTDVGLLLLQAAGEYQDKLEAGHLALILTPVEPPIYILADGKLLWRVFDNLLSNIGKYAMEGTRVYLSVQQEGTQVQISFKNISKFPLNIPAQELLERFTRGDSSRSTEGSGLGLSIANSLTELQGGTFHIFTDGDLFKAFLIFPAYTAL